MLIKPQAHKVYADTLGEPSPPSPHSRKPHLLRIPRIILPIGKAAIIERRDPSHIPPIFILIVPDRRSVQHRRVIPERHVPRAFPVQHPLVLVGRDVLHQVVDDLAPFGDGQAFDVVVVGADVQGRAAGGFVGLGEAVLGEGHCRAVDRLELLHVRVCLLAVPEEGVGADVVFDLVLGGLRQVVIGGACVEELGLAAGSLGRQLDGAQNGDARAARVVGAVGVPEGVAALAGDAQRVGGRDDVVVRVDVGDVEDLVLREAHLAPGGLVRGDVVQLAPGAAEVDHALVGDVGGAGDEDAVLAEGPEEFASHLFWDRFGEVEAIHASSECWPKGRDCEFLRCINHR